MTEQERIYFEALREDREESDKILQKPSMQGVKKSVVEKYSDQAHFIYELLQNADDAGATEANFVLYNDRLVFTHNGTRLFSVSNPQTEGEDTKNGTLGDINAITSVANSNKTQSEIGKFGVGFKSVFQYTSTPYIYDPNFRFYINDFIVPVGIQEDLPERKSDETAFVFPFNFKKKSKEDAYSDIADKLKKLKYPILFLTNLKFVSFKVADAPDFIGLYAKETEQSSDNNGTIIELVKLTHNVGDDLKDTRLWLFSRIYNNRRYSVGFFTDEEGKLVPVNECAFCFFPTKEVTNLNFVIHAPFLLTDSREGIKAGESYNNMMVQKLAALAADSIVLLRDIGVNRKQRLINDNIFDILPYDDSKFTPLEDREKISFLPFYTAIKEKFMTEEILPSTDGYVSKDNAYWADVPNLISIFSSAQLKILGDDEDAQWVFAQIGRAETMRTNEKKADYIDEIIYDSFDFESLINSITDEFIEEQEIDWLFKFYKYLSERKGRFEAVTSVPIFLDNNGKAVSVFDNRGHEILFLPEDGVEGYRTVSNELMKNEITITLLKQIGIKEPDLKDEIDNLIIPLYNKNGTVTDYDIHFLKFFNYYQECPNRELSNYVFSIYQLPFISGKSLDGTVCKGKASDFYMPTDDLKKYFVSKPDTKFIDLKKYLSLVGEENKEPLLKFLKELGCSTLPRIYKVEISRSEANKYDKKNWSRSTRESSWTIQVIDGLRENLSVISDDGNGELSVFLWNMLLKVIDANATRYGSRNLYSLLVGKYSYFYYNWNTIFFNTSEMYFLKNSCWLMNKDNKMCAPDNIFIEDLSDSYQVSDSAAKELISFLGLKEKPAVVEQLSPEETLTDEERKEIKYKNLFERYNVTSPEELESILEEHNRQQSMGSQSISYEDPLSGEDYATSGNNSKPTTQGGSSLGGNSAVAGGIGGATEDVPYVPEPVDKVINEIRNIPVPAHPKAERDEETFDEDDYIKPSVDYSKKIEQAEERSRIEIENITRLSQLQSTLENAEKYSYLWFKTLLELEAADSGEDSNDNREISISFAKAELEPGTTRTLILKHPSRYIPQFMEDLADIPLTLHYGNQTKRVAIEVINVKSYSVKVKLKTGTDIEGVDLSTVNEARIDAQNPTFLLKELINGINSLGFEDSFNMRDNLPKNIDFIFGPPGTGKTTHLAQNVILPLIQKEEKLKILVLTPTNKAADVITKRIMECDQTGSYSDWLIRFGTSNDEDIEHSGVYKDKTFDIRKTSKNVTVTTIARFPYDFFMPEDVRLHLCELKWDYIIIDEASMIHASNIIYPLYKKTPEKFIIAGDPFQIQPISKCDLWKDENIYTMVKLDSFTNPTTVPHAYKVELLTTQYRSVPSVGNIYSNFSYGGVLKNNRTELSKRNLNIGEYLDLKSLNIIKFPVSKYESIYKCKRLQSRTPYQIYSALFTFEFAKYLSEKISEKNESESFSIGIIAPYRAQADLIDKLIMSYDCPKNIDIQVGTIHGFQGDECNIVLAVFNPPPQITNSKDMFLNKRNIINVSISRARDYLIVIMPDEHTENINNLHLVNKVKNLCLINGCTDFSSPALEQIMFGDEHYLENNSFATSHQTVNVYGKPELKYEIRSEDTAVDIQIHTDIDKS